MAKITWKGEGASPPPALEWRGVTFPLGQAVEVDDPAIIAKAKTAVSIFKVEDDPPNPEPAPAPAPPPMPVPEDDDNDDDEDEDKPHRAVPRSPPPRGQAAMHRATRKKK